MSSKHSYFILFYIYNVSFINNMQQCILKIDTIYLKLRIYNIVFLYIFPMIKCYFRK